MALLTPVVYAGAVYAARCAVEKTFPPLSSGSYHSSNSLCYKIREVYEKNVSRPNSVPGSIVNFLYDNLHFIVGFHKAFCPSIGPYLGYQAMMYLCGMDLIRGRSGLSDLCNRIAGDSQTPSAQLARKIAAFVRPSFYIEASSDPSRCDRFPLFAALFFASHLC